MKGSIARPLPIFSLVCHRDIDTSAPALMSVVKHFKDPHELILLDDGSLSSEDHRLLNKQVPNARLIRRSELDSIINPLLIQYKRCKKFRDRWPWALKLIDLPIVAKGDFGYIDSDILALRNFTGLDARATPYDMVYMQSYANIYCTSLLDRLCLTKQWPCADRLNSGFMFVRQGRISLDFIEGALMALGRDAEMPLAEQTVWGMAAGSMNHTGIFNREQVAFPITLPIRPLVVHYVGITRHLMQKALLKPPTDDAVTVEQIKIYPSRNCNMLNGIIDIVRHRQILRCWKRHENDWLPT